MLCKVILQNFFKRAIFYLAFPYDQYIPTATFKFFNVSFISFYILSEFFFPKSSISSG